MVQKWKGRKKDLFTIQRFDDPDTILIVTRKKMQEIRRDLQDVRLVVKRIVKD